MCHVGNSMDRVHGETTTFFAEPLQQPLKVENILPKLASKAAWTTLGDLCERSRGQESLLGEPILLNPRQASCDRS
jgi:hypothetical protein